MGNVFLGFSLLLGLGAAVWAILAAHNLQKTYGTGALSTLLYYQIFIAVFGLYGIAGQGIVRMVLVSRASPAQTVEIVWHLFAVFGAPFLILAWSMFLRLSREIPGETPGRGLTLGFLFAAFGAYIAYGAAIVIVNLSGTGEAGLTSLAAAVRGVFVGLDAAVIAASVPRLLARARLISDGPRRAAVRAFSLAAAAAWAGRLILFVLSGQGAMFFSLYILVFFAGNILPLAVWRNYLINNVPSSWASVPLAWDMKKFSGEFNISRREEDVIRQVLEGKTNKEIAAALFITLQTVKDHLYRIFQKTDVRNRVQLINLVQSYGAEDPKSPNRD